MRAYHFLKADMTAGSGTEPAWAIGEERKVVGRLRMCVHGYHSSPTWRDALGYAPGLMACVVEIPTRGTLKDTTKQVSRKRQLVAAAYAANAVMLWGCECAERALVREREAKREPDKRSWAAIEVTRRYVEGKATKKELGAATAAANAAAAAYATAASASAAAAAAYATAASASAYAYAAYAANATAAANAAANEKEWQAVRLAEMLDGLLKKEAPDATPD